MIAKIMCGGPSKWFDFNHSNQDTVIIGVDGGALFLLNEGIIPDVSIGDFDSIQPNELLELEKVCPKVIKLSCEKDETDTEVAIQYAISLGVDEIHIYGAIGGRVDHTLANIRLLLQFVNQDIPLSIVDETNRLQLLAKGQHQLLKPIYRYISFFAVNETVNGLTLKGLKYSLKDYQLTQSDIRCISNEVLDETFSISFNSGYLLMINSQD